ncbi:MAG: asparagine synthase (glutamine-hydrolyzing) [Pseudomonadota bacterium]
MCGIAGVIGTNATERVHRMLQRMQHRGPDGDGVWQGHDELALGHRRLAINDLSNAGRQPMIAADRNTVITVNGEIYNYPSLRRELEDEGAVFHSNCDSEVVLHAWRQWGHECFIRFNGMFAIGLYDVVDDRLVLVRDRLGIKPLYYRLDADELIFASEITGLKAAINTTPKIDPVGLSQYLTYQNYFGDRTLHDAVKLLPPGNMLTRDRDGTVRLESYWQLEFSTANAGCRFDEAVDRYRETLDSAVHRHLLSDVPVAAYLSAGFDSGSVVSRASRQGHPPTCFTGRFDEGGWYDEATVASEIARANGSAHHGVDISPADLPRIMDLLQDALDEPRMGMGTFSQYCVAEQASKTHRVLLTGHGGDELFSGYPVFKLVFLLSQLRRGPSTWFRAVASVGRAEWPHIAYFLLSGLRTAMYRQFLPVLMSLRALLSGLTEPWRSRLADISPETELVALDGAEDDRMQVLYRHYLQAYLHGLLVAEDKLSMAHSVETRTPLLDNEMLDLSLALPQSVKLRDGELKAVIKSGGQPWLPKALYSQPKRGFPTPLRVWFRNELREWFEGRMTGPDSHLPMLFKTSWLKQTTEAFLNSARRHVRPLDEIQSQRMWQLLSLESWLRQNY